MKVSKLLRLVDAIPDLSTATIYANSYEELVISVNGQLTLNEHRYMIKRSFVTVDNENYVYRPRTK